MLLVIPTLPFHFLLVHSWPDSSAATVHRQDTGRKVIPRKNPSKPLEPLNYHEIPLQDVVSSNITKHLQKKQAVARLAVDPVQITLLLSTTFVDGTEREPGVDFRRGDNLP
jgi:hypothetical protein